MGERKGRQLQGWDFARGQWDYTVEIVFRGGIVGAGWEVEKKRGVDGVEVALDLGTII